MEYNKETRDKIRCMEATVEKIWFRWFNVTFNVWRTPSAKLVLDLLIEREIDVSHTSPVDIQSSLERY